VFDRVCDTVSQADCSHVNLFYSIFSYHSLCTVYTVYVMQAYNCIHCVAEKTSPFYIVILVRYHPILPIWNWHNVHHTSFYMFILYLEKLATIFTVYRTVTSATNMKSSYNSQIVTSSNVNSNT